MPEGLPATRREFLATAAATVGAVAVGAPTTKAEFAAPIKLGYDNFSVRAFGWKAPRLVDYADELKVDSLFITDLDAFESFDAKYLADVKARADGKGVQIHLGSWSICPTSTRFKKNWGTAEEHLALGIRMARALGSPVFRVVLGSGEDRVTPGGIRARIADTVKVCKSQRQFAIDSGVKIAVENHAGDMQAWELVTLVEEAGPDYVGVNLDSGNAAWTLEDPIASLETLGKYTVTTSLRDSYIWESPKGATVQWVAMGEGVVDLKKYFARFAELCPGVPVHIETISGFNREFPYLESKFWNAFPEARAKDLAAFVALAKKGKPKAPHRAAPGRNPADAEKEYQKEEIERSLKYCKEVLGLGIRR